MKAIIIAAGMGSRLGDHTKDRPKCLLDINGMPLLQYQIQAMKTNGIDDIILVKGYQAEKLNHPELRSYLNVDYSNNNVLCSLMKAEAEMNGPFMASYSDILYSAHVVQALKASPYDISLIVDVDWRKKYVGRTAHPESEAENVDFDEAGRITRIGKNLNDAPGEFIGLFQCSAQGADIWKDCFTEARRQYTGKPFFNAAVFEKAYITDMILYLISQNVQVHRVSITENWMEIDTEQDLVRARAWQAKEGW